MIVKVNNLVKRYKDFIAVDNVSFEIEKGEIFGLLGPNGAGKTTTISSLAGMSKFDGGEIRIFDMDLKKDEKEIKSRIGIVPQDIALYNDLTAYENLCYFGRLYGLRGGKLKENIEKALDFTGLTDRRKDYPSKYSGGMKRRLNIACAIVHQPELIIMDEPTVGIDPQSRNHILKSIKKLNEEGSTIIYTSHYMEEVEELCSNILIMDRGRVIAKGSQSQLKSLVAVDETIDVELSGMNFSIVDKIKALDGVIDCVVDGTKLKIVSKKQNHMLGRVIGIISDCAAEIISLNVETPNLETVFLTLTGKTLRN
jgi:ABC-2 type transport system ATP-binding protein